MGWEWEKPPKRRSPMDSGNNRKDKCCAMVEAGRSIRRGKFRLAARYARFGARVIAGRLA